MAISFGFFNDVNGDRLYNAEDIGRYLHGIVTNGVFPDDNTSLQVLASSGMGVTVQAGRAMLNCHYLENDSPLALTLTAGGTQDRIDAIVARLDLNNRLCEIAIKEGTPSASPVAPTMANTDVKLELMLASVYVAKLSLSITQDNITDTRANVDVCGWVTGLLDQNTIGVPVPSARFIGYIVTVNADGTGYELLPTDTTLSYDGAVADSAAVGRALAAKLNASAISAWALASTKPKYTPDEVGAAPAVHTHSAADVGAAPAVHTHTPDEVGAAAEKHNHSASDINSGTLGVARLPTVTMAKGGTGATNGATGLKNLLAAGATVLSSYQYGPTLPQAGTAGRLFFLLDE